MINIHHHQLFLFYLNFLAPSHDQSNIHTYTSNTRTQMLHCLPRALIDVESLVLLSIGRADVRQKRQVHMQ